MSVVIGITTRNATSEIYQIPMVAAPRSYVQAVLRAGALPVLIPLGLKPEDLRALLGKLDGVIFTGGGDIETARYNGVAHAMVEDVDAERDQQELQLVQDVIAADTPFLGICRGLQVVNVALGGTLYTHVADQLEGAVAHTFFPDYPWDHIAHAVQVSEGSRLAEIVGEPVLQVNSLHHQGVRELAPNLKATAKAPDGLIEALELPEHSFGLAVQWHPEWLPEDANMRALFSSFVAAAGNGQV